MKKSMAQLREGKITDEKKKEQEQQQRHRKEVFKCGKRQLDIKRPVSVYVCVCASSRISHNSPHTHSHLSPRVNIYT